jgi:hypothetical protein
MWTRAKYRAKKQGKDFTIDVSDIFIPTVCPILGIPLVVQAGKGHYDNTPSLDRIDNSKGYVKGNVAVISQKANQLKNWGSLEDFEKIVEYIKRLDKSE